MDVTSLPGRWLRLRSGRTTFDSERGLEYTFGERRRNWFFGAIPELVSRCFRGRHPDRSAGVPGTAAVAGAGVEAPSACGRSSQAAYPTPLDKQEAVLARSGGILCFRLSSYGKGTTRFLDLRRKASPARNDVHLSGYSISGFGLHSGFRAVASSLGGFKSSTNTKSRDGSQPVRLDQRLAVDPCRTCSRRLHLRDRVRAITTRVPGSPSTGETDLPGRLRQLLLSPARAKSVLPTLSSSTSGLVLASDDSCSLRPAAR